METESGGLRSVVTGGARSPCAPLDASSRGLPYWARAGYLQWRLALKEFHAGEAAAVLAREGYDVAFIDRVRMIIQRRTLKNDPDQQTLEDAICLTFLETQLTQTAEKINEVKLVGVSAEDDCQDVACGHRAGWTLAPFA